MESTSSGVDVSGMYTGAANSDYLIQFFASTNAEPYGIAEGHNSWDLLGDDRRAYRRGRFYGSDPGVRPGRTLVTATATDAVVITPRSSRVDF